MEEVYRFKTLSEFREEFKDFPKMPEGVPWKEDMDHLFGLEVNKDDYIQITSLTAPQGEISLADETQKEEGRKYSWYWNKLFFTMGPVVLTPAQAEELRKFKEEKAKKEEVLRKKLLGIIKKETKKWWTPIIEEEKKRKETEMSPKAKKIFDYLKGISGRDGEARQNENLAEICFMVLDEEFPKGKFREGYETYPEYPKFLAVIPIATTDGSQYPIGEVAVSMGGRHFITLEGNVGGDMTNRKRTVRMPTEKEMESLTEAQLNYFVRKKLVTE